MKFKISIAVAVCLGLVAGPSLAQSFGGGLAPGISEVWVMAVDSAAGGAELTERRVSTARHHGGSYVRVTTIERGMGQASANMNGAPLRETKTVNVCDRGGGYWIACRNGQTVEGHLRVWDATGKGNGTFTVRVTSNNWPRNTASKSLSIW